MYGGGEGLHRVLSPVVVDRDVRFVSGLKGILPIFIYFGFGKLEGSRLVLCWISRMSRGNVVLKVLATEDGRRPGDVEWIEIINCARSVVWWC